MKELKKGVNYKMPNGMTGVFLGEQRGLDALLFRPTSPVAPGVMLTHGKFLDMPNEPIVLGVWNGPGFAYFLVEIKD